MCSEGLMFVLSTSDPNADPVLAEERISQEASELEKRLSMLSQCSLASSTGTFLSSRHLEPYVEVVIYEHKVKIHFIQDL